ncbi:BLUF domain-containing protein [Azospirillum thermophilum]|nr:BLUF domain-containing protein [Azospirillum thermophilum]
MMSLMYRSEALRPPSMLELAEIALTSAYNNRDGGITGFLVHFEGTFLQVLEGEPERVEPLFGRIAADGRHENIRILERDMDRRSPVFGFWAMNIGPFDGPLFQRAVFGRRVDGREFAERSADRDYSFQVLLRAYLHACVIEDVTPIVRGRRPGAIPLLPNRRGAPWAMEAEPWAEPWAESWVEPPRGGNG